MMIVGDARAIPLADGSVQCVVTSPPYWGLRDYGVAGQIGREKTPEEYVAALVGVFGEVRRVLKADGTLWLNLGDSYAGSGKGGNPDEGKQATKRGSQTIGTLYGKNGKNGQTARDAALTNVSRRFTAQHETLKQKDLVGIPWMLAFALRADGWYLRSDIIWAKPNPMPESVTDRPTRSHEYLFLLSRSARYYYDAGAIAEPGVTAAKENYPARARITGRGTQGAADARGGDRDKSGGFPPRIDKQRGHGRRHDGFNDRWDAMERDGQCGYTRNKRSVWTIATVPYPGAHFATFPEKLVEPCILAGSRAGDIVFDPFAGSGTTVAVAYRLGRRGIGIELSPKYVHEQAQARTRCQLGLPA